MVAKTKGVNPVRLGGCLGAVQTHGVAQEIDVVRCREREVDCLHKGNE